MLDLDAYALSAYCVEIDHIVCLRQVGPNCKYYVKKLFVSIDYKDAP